ncbi:MAG: transglycosylase SLT domain-containing protein [Acidobacteriaceae bacterium]|nr:transglycosylase SLT domain-containing protein [Acidobacteriaceae bacterium]MBV9780281.1 transglycosylase SLT domain-containing protein [Acidobacteriaceae bacterium]
MGTLLLTASCWAQSQTTIPRDPSSTATDIHSAEGDERLARAETHFNSGRQLYFNSDMAGARREFDAAIDALLNASESLPDHRRIERRLDEMSDLIYRFDIEKLGSGASEQAVIFDQAPIDEISHMTFAPDPNLASKLKTELYQTTSAIPLDLSEPVLGYVNYFSTERGRSILLAGFRRAGRYKPVIERIFAEEGLPPELIYLAQAESGFLPRAVSRKQAVGMWQFIAGTGADYDLTRGAGLDERFDPEKATRAAARLLKDLHARYGDWYLAMAAYNCGAGAVDRAVQRTGYADYWELLKRHALPKETASYVPIIVAMTIMAKNPKDYGLENIEIDAPLEYDSFLLSAPTNLNLVADATMQPVSEIRDLNPSILGSVAPAGFSIHVPKASAESAEAALETVPAENRRAWRLHHVEAGDTLETIASAYHLRAESIAAVNRATDSLEAGDMLLIPAVFHEEPQARRSRCARARRGLSGTFRSTTSGAMRRSTRVAALHRVPAQVLHRKAAIRTAMLGQ